jgi:biopolymer transport protein ExbB
MMKQDAHGIGTVMVGRLGRGLAGAARPAAGLGVLLLAGAAAAQDGAATGEAAGGGEEHVSLWGLVWGSADLFTVLLVAASLTAAFVIARCAIEIRGRYILPIDAERNIRTLISARRWEELRQYVSHDDAFVSAVVRSALEAPEEAGAVREAAELAAGEQCARWLRKVEPLNIIGTLGPLLGLAGTVWGMIIAFASLGETGGRAGPGELSLGISKALFHTLLGLMLAVPALASLAFFRTRVEALCTRAMSISAQLVEGLIAGKTKA